MSFAGLNLQANRLIEKGISTLEHEAEPETMTEVEEEEWIQEPRLVPTEVWEDEPVEKIEYRHVPEERSIPQVRKFVYAEIINFKERKNYWIFMKKMYFFR